KVLAKASSVLPLNGCSQPCVAVNMSTRSHLQQPLEVIVEILFRMNSMADAEYMRRNRMWVDFDIVSWSLPKVMRVRYQIQHLERALRIEAQAVEIQFQPPRMDVVWAEVDDDQNDIRPI